MVHVARKVRSIEEPDQPQSQHPTLPLEDFRTNSAWVLLGEPGSGKSDSFKAEADATDGFCLRIAEFIVLTELEALRGKTLFLDGLDEVRASGNGDSILLQVRQRLGQLGHPRFRIACRAADWLGSTDREEIKGASPDGTFATLKLEPLGEDDIVEILRQNHGITDPVEFVETARHRGIADLLDNPKTLELLANAIGGGEWPGTRKETFRLACEKLAGEDSSLHRKKTRQAAPSIESILEASGHLCAVLLLSDNTGLALDQDQSAPGFPWLDSCSPADLNTARWAVRRKLFRADDKEERVVPNHRSVAEYLAARWIATRIDQNGLPVGRVLNLLVGREGRPVAGLRGLFAWLALLCTSARTRLLAADPLSVVVYGDVKPMSDADKRQLLDSLRNEAENHAAFRWGARSTHAFAPLVAPDFLDYVRAALLSPDRSDGAQAFADCLLDALIEGNPLPELEPVLKNAIEDGSRWGVVRKGALKVWLKVAPEKEALLLLNAITDDHMRDAEDELTGILLDALYPGSISPHDLLRHLHIRRVENLIGHYARFWAEKLPKKVPSSDLPALLDAMSNHPEIIKAIGKDFHFKRMTGKLLAQGIDEHGDATSDERLFSWLGLGQDDDHYVRLDEKERQRIVGWLAAHPDRYKGVLSICFQRCEGHEQASFCVHANERRLRQARPPEDIGLWHFEQIDQTHDEKLAREHLHKAVDALIYEQNCRGLSLELLATWGEKNPQRKTWLDERLVWEWSPTDWRAQDAARARSRQQERDAQKRETTVQLSKHLTEIEQGCANPALMHQLACVWMNLFIDTPGETPAERFNEYCENGAEVLVAAELGFVACINRDNLPGVQEIIALNIKQQEHLIRLPCLIGMDLRFREGPALIDQLPGETLQRMLAFRLTYGADNTPDWFLYLVNTRPALVAEVLVEYATQTLKSKREHVDSIYPLAHDLAYQAVARIAVPTILERFPTRAAASRLYSLDLLLKAALRYRMPELGGLLENKIALKGMDAPQKVYWLATGLLLQPSQYESMLWQHVGKSATRANYLSGFLADGESGSDSNDAVSANTLAKLAALFAPHAEFDRPRGQGAFRVTEAMDRGDHVRALIRRLGTMGTEEAIQALDRLLADRTLSKAKFALEDARQQAITRRREGEFRFLPLAGVAQVLSNRAPASVSDLTALTLDHLDDIAREIRQNNDDGFRAFWNVNHKNEPTSQRLENLCRDALLPRLRARLERQEIDCQPEADHANDKRTDIRLSLGVRFSLPVEIKRDSNATLWTALRAQLIDQYAIDPKASGHGIYLVLWFGGEGMPRANDGGKKPRSPEELRERLEASLAMEERQRIFVRVIDVSWPK